MSRRSLSLFLLVLMLAGVQPADASPKAQLIAPAYDRARSSGDCYEGFPPQPVILTECSAAASADAPTGRVTFAVDAGSGWDTDTRVELNQVFTPKYPKSSVTAILRLTVAYARVSGGSSWIDARFSPSLSCPRCQVSRPFGYVRLVGTGEGEAPELTNTVVDVPVTFTTTDGSDIPLEQGSVDVYLEGIGLSNLTESAVVEADITVSVLLQP